MSSKSKRSHRKPSEPQAPEQPQPNEEQIEEIKSQADEAVRLLGLVRNRFAEMIDVIPKNRLAEYLRHGNRQTYARYFKGFRIEHIPRARLIGFLSDEVYLNKNGMLAHIIIMLWNDEQQALYEATRQRLQVLNPNVELIEVVPPELSRQILTELLAEFPKDDVAILCMVNDARFDRAVIQELLPEWEWPPLKAKPAAPDAPADVAPPPAADQP